MAVKKKKGVCHFLPGEERNTGGASSTKTKRPGGHGWSEGEWGGGEEGEVEADLGLGREDRKEKVGSWSGGIKPPISWSRAGPGDREPQGSPGGQS